MLGPWCRFNEAIIIVITIVNAIAILMIVTYIALFGDGFSLHLFWITVTRFFQKCLVGSLVRWFVMNKLSPSKIQSQPGRKSWHGIQPILG